MITLNCTKCRATLTVDDAFAGGTCRCQHCGTIQIVARVREPAAPSSGAVAEAAQSSTRTLYRGRRTAAGAPPGSGLDELGEIIASSGLASSHLRHRPPQSAPRRAAAAAQHLKLSPAVAGGAAAVLVVLVTLLVWLGGNKDQSPIAPPSPNARATDNTTPEGPPLVTTGPNFLGIALQGPTVVYVLDRGSATGEPFGHLKEATFRSLQSLGSDRNFQVIFWDNGSVEAYPPATALPATPGNIASARTELADVFAFGQSDAEPALRQAMRSNPSDIVLVTAKWWDLDDAFVAMVREVTAESSVRVHTVALGGTDVAGALDAVAREFRGQFRAVTTSELRAASR